MPTPPPEPIAAPAPSEGLVGGINEADVALLTDPTADHSALDRELDEALKELGGEESEGQELCQRCHAQPIFTQDGTGEWICERCVDEDEDFADLEDGYDPLNDEPDDAVEDDEPDDDFDPY